MTFQRANHTRCEICGEQPIIIMEEQNLLIMYCKECGTLEHHYFSLEEPGKGVEKTILVPKNKSFTSLNDLISSGY